MKKLIISVGMLFFAAAIYAAGNNVIAEWDFSKINPLKGKYNLVLRGNTKLADNALILLNETLNQPGGALVKNADPALTPANAFRIDAVINLNKDFKRAQNWMMIYDHKYVVMPTQEKQKKLYNCGFMFYLQPRGGNRYRMAAAFGYGDSSAAAFSKDFTLQYGVDAALAMHFNATGKVMFYLDGKLLSSTNVPAGTLAPAKSSPVLGDRIGSNYASLGGMLKKLTITNMPYQQAAFTSDPARRRVFERGEKTCNLYIFLENRSRKALKDITIEADGKFIAIKTINVPANSKFNITLPVDPTLLPGTYKCTLTAKNSAGKVVAQNDIEYTIAPSYGDFMPVIMWGTLYKPALLKEYGFTHEILHFFPHSGTYNLQSLPGHITLLDDYLKNNFYSVGTLHGHYRFLKPNRFLRTDRNGKVYSRKNLEASHPEVQKEFAEAAFDTASKIADHPAFDGCLINSEVRDGSLPSFGSGVEPAAFKKFAGYDIPLSLTGKTPPDYLSDKKFPWDGVIADNTPEMTFIRWFWLQGDGWNPLQTLLSDTLHRAVDNYEHKKRFFTFYDPVTRTPPLWGSGGNVDMISQWTYTYPDPIIIGQTTDEVIAMAQGNPRQKIASMTQAIWYRSQTAPLNEKVKNPPSWLDYEPKATFLSIAPDSLREALWVKISRRLDAIMYHGVGSLIERTDHWGYRYTNDQSREVLKELSNTVIKPLGPVLKRVPERPAEVAILESFASSQYLAKHFPLGWGKGWMANLHLALQWGHYQPAIIYDEHLLNDRNIDQLKVLFVPALGVVSENVLQKLNMLRKRGVIIIGDEYTTPALMVDYRIKSVERQSKNPAATKKALQQLSKEINTILAGKYSSNFSAGNQDLVVRRRGSDQADYVFVVNDKRTFGNYVGQWGLVQEKGLPNSGKVTVNHPAAAAYDLVSHKEIKLEKTATSSTFTADLAPGDGRLILLLDRKIEKIELEAPSVVERNQAFKISVSICDGKGTKINAILPIKITLQSADGTILPGSGYYAAESGKFTLNEVMASNAPTGKVTVRIQDLASGKSQQKIFEVK